MKKTLLILYPYKFTEFEYYKYELLHLEKKKNYKIIIHDLSNFLLSKQFNNSWRTPREKRAIEFSSLISWIHEFNKIRKIKNVLIYDFVHVDDFKSLIIKLFLMLSKLPVIPHKAGHDGVLSWEAKRNLKHFLKKILIHKLNIKVYLYAIKHNFFGLLIKYIKFNKTFLMTNKDFSLHNPKKNIYIIRAHHNDYSNSLLEKYENSNKKNKKQFIVYLDNPGPYFLGDNLLKGNKLPKYDIKKWYGELGIFFDNLEKLFKTKVLIIPHAKFKIPSLKMKNINPYFNNRLNDNSYNAAAKFIPKSLFVICKGSSATSHAVASYKPIQFIYSSTFPYEEEEYRSLFTMGKALGMLPLDITSFKKKDIFKNFKVNIAKYDSYKFKYLTYKNLKSEKPNYKIIEELMDKSI